MERGGGVGKVGRRPGPSQSREQILKSARDLFAERGYTGTTVRAVAAAAGVQPGLLHHFFGGKEQLYREALNLSVDPWEVLTRLIDDTPRSQIAEALARQFVTSWRDPVLGPQLRARVRQTYGEPDGSSMTRVHMENVLIPRFASALEIPEANVAAALSHLVGLTLLDTVIGVQQLHGLSENELVELVEPAISRYITPPPT
jgi:AcrR family transcriptional regulator